MNVIELFGRVAYYVLRPVIHIFIRGSRRAYVAIEHDGKILVVKNVIGSGKWHLPGGGCHKHETFEQAAARELKEEVGIVLDPSQLTSISDATFRSRRGFDYKLFSATLSQTTELKLDQREISRAEWVEPSILTVNNAGESTLQAVRNQSIMS